MDLGQSRLRPRASSIRLRPDLITTFAALARVDPSIVRGLLALPENPDPAHRRAPRVHLSDSVQGLLELGRLVPRLALRVEVVDDDLGRHPAAVAPDELRDRLQEVVEAHRRPPRALTL
ncbi:hypothetical protein CHU98_g12119 [Xylaria longipes]|nr:hypothetical protein CHU98_g12119 [Xylaria longipes]